MVKPRPNLKELSAYSLPSLTAKYKLNANESPWELPEAIKTGINAEVAALNFARYPDPSCSSLKKAISEWLNVKTSEILLGGGSNEVIQCAFLAYGGVGRRAMSIYPTYAMAPKISAITGTEISYIKTDADFELDIERAYFEIKKQKPHIFYIANPNNPTGRYVDVADLKKLLELADTLFLVDEAYGEFCEGSMLEFLPDFPNLSIVKTFSKAYRMAGLRLGIILSSEDIICEMTKVKLPYNVNSVTQMAAERIIRNRALLSDDIALIKAEREKIYDFLVNNVNASVVRSSANFLLFRTKFRADELFKMLYGNGILVRNFDGYQGLSGYLRVTVGTPRENQVFFKAMRIAISRLEGGVS
ncbi:MAG: histidinol-phosphate transaminase [Actinobacteria bacterium]|nr:histidinol-phosphate transaminase [Actinomycetota bacterium]